MYIALHVLNVVVVAFIWLGALWTEWDWGRADPVKTWWLNPTPVLRSILYAMAGGIFVAGHFFIYLLRAKHGS